MNENAHINSLSNLLINQNPKSAKLILYVIFALVVIFLVWAYNAKIDQLVRGESKVVPYGENQIVQNFDGGIITKILVNEGDLVQKGEVLIKLQNKESLSTYEKNVLEINELKAEQKRLYAEANAKEFLYDKNSSLELKEYELYKSDIRQFNSKLAVLNEQVKQKQKEAKEIRSRVLHLKENFALILKEQKVMEPLVKEGIVSKVEYLKLLREANSIKEELESTKLSLNVTHSAIDEYKNRQQEATEEFKNKAHKEYSDISDKIEQFLAKNQGLEDRVKRTSVTSPVTGYIKKMYVNTIGGSVKPGMDLVEIVPKDKELLVEAKIKPEDIALVYPGQDVTLKFSAYDFAIYGSLKGKIVRISPDSMTDRDRRNIYYLVNIKADKDYLGNKKDPKYILPGMRGSADIIAGQNTILNYILKPIIKTKQYAFTEK